jgi:hypothetical protein
MIMKKKLEASFADQLWCFPFRVLWRESRHLSLADRLTAQRVTDVRVGIRHLRA